MQCKHCDTEIEMVGGRWQHVAPADEKYPQDCPGDELDEAGWWWQARPTGTLLEGWLRAGTAAVEIARHLARREEWSSSDLDVIADILVRAGLFKPEGPMAAVAGVAREPMLSLDQLADLAWDKVPTEAEHASIIEHFRSTPPESAYAQARHYMLTKRLAERYPDEYSGVTG